MNIYKIFDGNIRQNIKTTNAKARVPVWGVLKYDGYGMGLLHMAELFAGSGLTRFAVCNFSEAHTLRMAGFEDEDILLLSPQAYKDEVLQALKDNCIFSVGSTEYAAMVSSVAVRQNKNARVHVAVDTGLGRFGFFPDDVYEIRDIYRWGGLKVEGIYSHFAAAASNPSYTEMQYYQFLDVLEKLEAMGVKRGMAHISSSAAVFKYGNMNLDAVRIGSAFLGKVAGTDIKKTGLQKTGILIAKVLEVRDLPAGSSAGYNCTQKLWKNTRVAVLSAGRIHGIPARAGLERLKGKYTMANINGAQVKLIVTNCESHAIADVTGVDVRAGDLAYIDINPIYMGSDVVRDYNDFQAFSAANVF